jgi:hypothetical protein
MPRRSYLGTGEGWLSHPVRVWAFGPPALLDTAFTACRSDQSLHVRLASVSTA